MSESIEKLKNSLLVADPEAVYECLNECLAYFEDRMDADYDCGRFIPNEEMKMFMLVDETIKKANSTNKGQDNECQHEWKHCSPIMKAGKEYTRLCVRCTYSERFIYQRERFA